jgi:flagellum-specific peptidoglycan hydrolase FlgJ
MDKKEFVKKYLPEAQKASDIILQKYGKKVFVGTILVRAAIESGWGEKAPQNNFFGIKDFDGVNGNEFLLTTTEFHKTRNVKYPKILSIIWEKARGLFRYKVQDYFRKYATPSDSFVDFCEFLVKNNRYSKVFSQPDAMCQGLEICKAGYATSPDSMTLTRLVTLSIEKIIII